MKKCNRPLYLLLAMGCLPFILACALYFGPYTPNTTNQGHLLTPPLAANFVAKAKITPTPPKKTWKVFYICEKYCQKDQEKLDKVWRLLGKNKLRVAPIVLVKKEVDTQPLYHLVYQTLPTAILQAKKAHPHAFLFISDPLDNLIMAYDQPTWPKAMYSDLKKLLRASQIG